MKTRKIAVIHRDEHCAENVRHTVGMLAKLTPELTVFVSAGLGEWIEPDLDMCLVRRVEIPAGLDSEPKIRNWVNAQYESFDGFLHVLSDSAEVTADPSAFVSDLERMMDMLDYPVWFSTCTDGCNYVYSKYNPRMRVRCDRAECAAMGLPQELCFTSHANTQWIVYDVPALAGTSLLRFDESFTVPMFFIIEFLARRRNTKPAGSLFYMN